MLFSKRWATNFSVHERVNTRSYEILTVSFRPHYLPREFCQVTVIPVYIPGPDIDTQAAERVVESYNRAINRSGDQAVFVLGDFNACDITGLLPKLHQNVTCPTRFNKTIDLCFSNVPDAFQSLCRPPLGRSDHNVTHLVPEYRQKLNVKKLGHTICDYRTR